ncbi:MAG: hypothetical protein LIR25_02410 [bacterium]|nr:hypothetical protein [bacterium]
MKKTVAVLLLLAVVITGVFADDAKPETKNLIHSITIDGGFDMLYSKGHEDLPNDQNPREFTNSAFGAGACIALTLDLSAVPNFLKEGWFGYIDGGVYFTGKVRIDDHDFPEEGDQRNFTFLGAKSHVAILRQVDFGIPVDFAFGGGFAFDMINLSYKHYDVVYMESVQNWGASLFIMADYNLGKHFAVTAVINPDFTFLTVVDKKQQYKGSEIITRYISFGFGFSLGARLGFKYIF